MLGKLLKGMAAPRADAVPTIAVDPTRPALLNVGGGSKTIPIPPHYEGWQHLLLDIDPKGGAEVVFDARELERLPTGVFDAIYCSHNLEHYYHHEVRRVLAGFLHLLKGSGFAEIRVPDLEAVFREIVMKGRSLDEQFQPNPRGPITARDIIYGWTVEIEESGTDFYAHKTGFTWATLSGALQRAGFGEVWKAPPMVAYELRALAFRQPSTPAQRQLLGIPGG
jgi:predicted SAM-dependent methyltransferase